VIKLLVNLAKTGIVLLIGAFALAFMIGDLSDMNPVSFTGASLIAVVVTVIVNKLREER
jgi:hypothetical protein